MGDQEVRALDGVSLDIHEGEFVAIMGPSGSGKSSLMNLIGALDRPTSGEMWINGRALSEMNRDELADLRNETLGFVFQQFNLLARQDAFPECPPAPSLRPQGNRRHRRPRQGLPRTRRPWHAHGPPPNAAFRRPAAARRHRPRPVQPPRILLADEPTGALDTKTTVEIMHLMQDLNKQGITVVVITHETKSPDTPSARSISATARSKSTPRIPDLKRAIGGRA
jgi:putative ABC transport system ATP-binding protein